MRKKLLPSLLILSGLSGWSLPLGQGNPGAVVDRFFQAYQSGSVDDMLQIYAEDALFEDVSQRHILRGQEQLREMLTRIVATHKRMEIREKRRIIQGDTVVVEYEYAGQLNGAVLAKSVGKEACPDLEYRLPTTSWYRIQGNRLVEQKDFIDFATFLDLRQQMLTASH